MQFQHAENAEYGLSAVLPLHQSAWNHHDPPAWEFPSEISMSGIHSLAQTCSSLHADIKPRSLHTRDCIKSPAEGTDCDDDGDDHRHHLNAPVIDDLGAMVMKKYNGEAYNNPAIPSSLRSSLTFLGFQQQQPPQYGTLPVLRFSDSQNSMANGFKSHLQNPEVARTILSKPLQDWRNQAFGENKSLGLMTSPRKNHILSERQRRSGMNQLYARMQSVLPNIGTRKATVEILQTDKASLVSEMIKYIQSLQCRLDARSKERQSIAAVQGAQGTLPVVMSEPITTSTNSPQTASSSVCNGSINACTNMTSATADIACGKQSVRTGSDQFTFHCDLHGIFITMICENKANLLPSIILVLECYGLEVMDAFVSTTETVAFNCIHLKVPEILDPQTTETLKGILQKLMRSDFRINFPQP